METKKRGRKPGVRTGPHPGSLFGRMDRMKVGEQIWQPAGNDHRTAKLVATTNRWPEGWEGRKYTTKQYQAIPAHWEDQPPVRLVMIERVA